MSENVERPVYDSSELQELAFDLQRQLSDSQDRLGLTNVEVGKRTGLSRLTVQRAKTREGDPQLSTFVAIAAAVGLNPMLIGQADKPGQIWERNIVHRGLSYNRLKRDPSWRDTQRETAIAKAWETANAFEGTAFSPIMKHLIPEHTQAQASAAATVLQWLGSDVGFDFLCKTLESSGYAVTDTKKG